jgi:hypothetical protein
MDRKDDMLFAYWWSKVQSEFPRINKNDAKEIFLSACNIKNKQIEELETKTKQSSSQDKSQKLSEL